MKLKAECGRVARFAARFAAIGAMVIISNVYAEVEMASATADVAIAVDSREGEVHSVVPGKIEYSPVWCGVSEEGAYVVIEKVEHAGMFNAATSVVTTCSVDAEGAYSFSVGASDAPCVRLIHRVYSSDGTEIGVPLERDIAFGVSSAPSEMSFVDCRTNSLLERVAFGGLARLTYDTDWATNAEAVAISAVRLSVEGGVGTDTNALFSAEADATGEMPLLGLPCGWCRLSLRICGAGDSTLLEYVSPDFKIKGGFTMILR